MPSLQRSNLEFILFAMGSAGDIFPMIAVGKALRERGHSVVVAVNPVFEGAVREAGLTFTAIGSAEAYRRRMNDPALWQFGKGFKVLFTDMLENIRPLFDTIRARAVPGRTVVVSPSAGFGARLANEALDVPLVNLQLQPIAFRSVYDQPGLDVPRALRPLLPVVRRGWLRMLDRRLLDPQLAPAVNAFRAELGLPPVSRVFDRWAFSPDLVIGLFPDWFAPPQPDWPAQVKLTGFPLSDSGGESALPTELAQFLDEGDPPIVFTLGTAMKFAAPFLKTSAEVCRLHKVRGVLVTRFRDQLPAPLPAGVLHVDHAPFSRLLPRARAIVHHGGIGTLAQAMRAGIPQLVTPMNFDQPDNALRLVRLGVGDRISLRKYEPSVAARKLATLLASPSVAASCRAVAKRLADADAMSATCRLIESVAPAMLARHGAA